MIAAIAFDCDGVLVDSETITAELLVELTNVRGGHLTLVQGRQMFHGAPLELCVQRIMSHLEYDIAADIAAEYRSRSAEEFRRRLRASAGVERLVRDIRLPCCVVSNSSRDRTIQKLEVTGLLKYFAGRIFCADDLRRWKPDPDIYLHAAAEMLVEPTRCLAIEDSFIGVRAAAGAGMQVIGFAPEEFAASLAHGGARWTCSTMSEVANVIQQLGHHG